MFSKHAISQIRHQIYQNGIKKFNRLELECYLLTCINYIENFDSGVIDSKVEVKEEKKYIPTPSSTTMIISQPPPIQSQHTCTICLESIDSKEMKMTHCKHTFHRDCLQKWITFNEGSGKIAKCPNCRSSLYSHGPQLAPIPIRTQPILRPIYPSGVITQEFIRWSKYRSSLIRRPTHHHCFDCNKEFKSNESILLHINCTKVVLIHRKCIIRGRYRREFLPKMGISKFFRPLSTLNNRSLPYYRRHGSFDICELLNNCRSQQSLS